MEPRHDPQNKFLGFRSLVNTVHSSKGLSKKGLFVPAIACQFVLPALAKEAAAVPVVVEPFATSHEQPQSLETLSATPLPGTEALALTDPQLSSPRSDTFLTLLPTPAPPTLPATWQSQPSDELYSPVPLQSELSLPQQLPEPASAQLPEHPLPQVSLPAEPEETVHLSSLPEWLPAEQSWIEHLPSLPSPSLPVVVESSVVVPNVIAPIIRPDSQAASVEDSIPLPLFRFSATNRETSEDLESALRLETGSVAPPILIAGPQGLNPGLSQPGNDQSSPENLPIVVPQAIPQTVPQTTPVPDEPPIPSNNLDKPPIESVVESNPPAETAPFIRWDNLEVGLQNSFSSFGESSWKISPTISGQLANGATLQFATGYNRFAQTDVEPVTHIPLTLGWQGKVNEVELAFKGGVDIFDRLPATVHFGSRAAFSLGETAVLSVNLEQGPHDFNARTLENEISHWRYGPDLSWQITPEVSLFSQLRIGNYSDGNWEQQSYSRLERAIGDEAAVALTLTNLSFQENVESTSGYFSPPDFLIATAELSWQEQLAKGLSCGLKGSLGQQRLEGEWALAYDSQLGCIVDVTPTLQLDVGYRYSNVSEDQSALASDSAFNNQEIIAGVRIQF